MERAIRLGGIRLWRVRLEKKMKIGQEMSQADEEDLQAWGEEGDSELLRGEGLYDHAEGLVQVERCTFSDS